MMCLVRGDSAKYCGFPHARGDGPSRWFRPTSQSSFSPRAWGWSGIHGDDFAGCAVFPTRVGMVRTSDTT